MKPNKACKNLLNNIGACQKRSWCSDAKEQWETYYDSIKQYAILGKMFKRIVKIVS